jgi:hypothetical protein
MEAFLESSHALDRRIEQGRQEACQCVAVRMPDGEDGTQAIRVRECVHTDREKVARNQCRENGSLR